jgi:hypothetical protein
MSRKEIIDKFQTKWISRKLFVFLIASVALFTGNLTSGDWVTIATFYISFEGSITIIEKVLKARGGSENTNTQNLE